MDIPQKSRRLADDAYAGIVQMIVTEGIQVGQRLPSEVQLTERLGVSRAIIREALARLQSDGLTQARVGSGSYVTRRPDRLLAQHLPFDAIASAFGTYEVRFVLEPEAARFAAIRHSVEDMQAIAACLTALQQALLSGHPADAEDLELHRAIMIASGNIGFVETFDASSPPPFRSCGRAWRFRAPARPRSSRPCSRSMRISSRPSAWATANAPP
jgi:DNA-binding FadR family transcriptional regulator